MMGPNYLPVFLSIHFVSFHFDKLPVEWFIAYTQTLDRLHSQPQPKFWTVSALIYPHTYTGQAYSKPRKWLTGFIYDFLSLLFFFNSLNEMLRHQTCLMRVFRYEHLRLPHGKVWLKCNEIGWIKRGSRMKKLKSGDMDRRCIPDWLNRFVTWLTEGFNFSHGRLLCVKMLENSLEFNHSKVVHTILINQVFHGDIFFSVLSVSVISIFLIFLAKNSQLIFIN